MLQALRSPSTAQRRLVLVLFFLSGAAGLIYEISWARQIGLLLGHTAGAAAIVLSSYFTGMAIGYAAAGRYVSRLRPLVGYAAAELLVVVWACLIPMLLALAQMPAVLDLLRSESSTTQLAARAVFCFLLLLPATVPLGATLPFVTQYVGGNSDKANYAAYAYAANTFGAFVGVLAATFALLITLGVARSCYFAAALSLFCAAGAIAIQVFDTHRKLAMIVADRSAITAFGSRSDPRLTETASGRSLWYAVAAVSGFGTLALEVLYTRLFALVFHNSTYTFGLVVAVFLLALAAGSALVGLLQRRFSASGLATLGCLAGAVVTPISVAAFVGFARFRYFEAGTTFTAYALAAFGLVASVVGPSICFLGMVLPAAWKVVLDQSTTESAGRVVGRLTAANTIAAAIGSVAASFLMLRWMGLWYSFAAVSGLFALLAVLIAWRTVAQSLVAACAVAVAAVIVIVIALQVPQQVQQNRSANANERVIRRWNSAYGWIELAERRLPDGKTEKTIRQNIHYRHGSTGAAATREYRQAHLPLLLHPQPNDVVFIGMGTGLTAGAATIHPEVKRITVVELIPEVVQAAGMLAADNFDLATNPKVRIVIDDGRHYLLGDVPNADVIVSDLFVPWESETGYLYTVEHYRAARARLNEGGLFCQWLALYQVGAEELEMIADSFATVFPQTTLWMGNRSTRYGMICLIGSDAPLVVDDSQLGQRLNHLWTLRRKDPLLASPTRLSMLHIGRWRIRNPSRLNTDEYPRVEFLAPITHKDRARPRLYGSALRSYQQRVLDTLPQE